MVSDQDEIEAIRAEEARRSKRPRDLAEIKRKRDLNRKFLELLKSGDEYEFQEALIRDLLQLPGTPEYTQSMKIWKQYHGGK
jgi:hypothetical protein